MFKNYISITLRNILRHKGYSAVNIAGLVIGMTGFTFLMLFVINEWNFDRFHLNRDRLVVVSQHTDMATGPQVYSATQAPMAPLLKESIPGIEDYIRSVGRMHTLSYDGKSHQQTIYFADSSILTVLSFKMLKGDPISALRSPRSVVLTESAVNKYFGNVDPMGKILFLNKNIGLEVTGVVENIPSNSTIEFTVLAPFDLLKEVGEDPKKWAGFDYFTLLFTSQGLSNSDISKRVGEFCNSFYGKRFGSEETLTRYYTVPFSELHLYGADGNSGSMDSLLAAFIIAVSLLIVSCINFIMLTTARINHRCREAGIRKVLGAVPGQIVRQILFETTSISVLAMLIALLIVTSTISLFNQYSPVEFRLESFLIELGGMMVIWVLLTGVLAGIFPAIIMSGAQTIGTVNGQFVKGSSGRKLRHIMVVAQISISVIFLMLSTLMYQQLYFIMTKDIGMDKDDIITFPATHELRNSFDTFKKRLLEQPGVLAVTYAGQIIENISSNTSGGLDFNGCDPELVIELHFDRVGYDYDKVFDLQMAEGRFYSEKNASDARQGIVMNEEAIRIMGIEDPVGKRFSYWGRDKTIIGVVKDFHFEPLNENIKPLILILEPELNFIYIKIASSNQKEIIASIERTCKEFTPGAGFGYSYLSTRFLNAQSSFLQILGIVNWATILVAFIASLGLLGLISFLAERRQHEIGIRKTLGASTFGIVKLFIKEFMKLVAIALIIGCPLGYIFGSNWLNRLPFHTDIGWELYALTGLLTIAFVLLSIGLQVIRAARAKPVDVLNRE